MKAQEARELYASKREERFTIITTFISSKIKEQSEHGYNLCYLELPHSFRADIENWLSHNGYSVLENSVGKNPMFVNMLVTW